MKNINSLRVFNRNKLEVNPDGSYVLYWMQSSRRLEHHFGIEYAVAWANKLKLPLIVYEGLNADYQWNSLRHHQFILEGMVQRQATLSDLEIPHFFAIEKYAGEAKGMVYKLASKAAMVVSDEHPVFMCKAINSRVQDKLDCKFVTIDSNGLIPMAVSKKDPYTAYLFRKIMQKSFADAYNNPPKSEPLEELANKTPLTNLLPKELIDFNNGMLHRLQNVQEFLDSMEFDYDVPKSIFHGSRSSALKQLNQFLDKRLHRYDSDRNHPDRPAGSGLSPWLHFGVISTHEIIQAVIQQDNPSWTTDLLTPNNGKNSGFFNLSVDTESFLDEIITWREVGFHYAYHRDDYDRLDSLPDWALATMQAHTNDEREYIYSYEQLDNAETHDSIWNAAQRQLREEGVIHNYLRMLWGKKVIEWTPDYETALKYLIELNNVYAIDGRDPNSYSGIFWCFGRFDRAWTERKIHGKLRYMASKNTYKKVKMDAYLSKWNKDDKQLSF